MNNIESELIGIINAEGNINGDLNIGYEKILPKLQEKTATPIKAQQVIEPDINYDGLSKVNVKAIPNEYIVPTGTLNITSNNTYDVKNYENAYVNIATPEINLQNKSITIDSNTTTNITYDEGFDGLGDVSITTQVPIPQNANLVVESIRTKNMFNGIFTQGYHTSSTATNRICNVGMLPIKSINGKKYTLSTNLPNTFKWKIMNCSTNQLNPTIYTDTNYVSSGSITITCVNDGYLIILVGKANDGNLTPSDVASYNFQIEEGSTATTYSEYQELNIQPIQGVVGGRNTTYVTNVGYTSLWIFGNLCVVSFNYQLANNIPNNTALITGIPSCKASRFVFIGSTGNNEYRFYIQGDKVYNDGVISTGGWIAANFVYPIG